MRIKKIFHSLQHSGLYQYKPMLLIAVICCLLQLAIFFQPNLHELLAYKQIEVSHGQWYRILTSALIHTNTPHLAMNLLGLALISMLYQEQLTDIKVVLVWMGIVILSSVSLLIFYPEIEWFVGLSGSLHGLIVWAALSQLPKHLYSNLLILFGLSIKLYMEHFYGGDPLSSQLIEARVLTEGHLTGALSGLLLATFSHCMLLIRQTGK
jgi:rhomboid family GlyGly-CTERM serine protease